MAKDKVKQNHSYNTDEKRIQLGKEICELYANNNFTLESCCNSKGIGLETFNKWKRELGELGDAYKTAKAQSAINYNTRVREKAKKQAERLIEGWEYKKTTKEIKKVGDREYTRITESTEVVLPNVAMTIFMLTNTNNAESDEYFNNLRNEHTGKNGGAIQMRKLPEWMQEVEEDKKSPN